MKRRAILLVSNFVLVAMLSMCAATGVSAQRAGAANTLASARHFQQGRPTVRQIPSDGINLAFGKPTAASSIEDTRYYPYNVVDNNFATRWSSGGGHGTEWVQIDLQNLYFISRVNLYWEAAYASGYQIQTSFDKQTWTPLYSTTVGTGGNQNVTGLSGLGRYVRVYATHYSPTHINYSLDEVQVYGEASGPQGPQGPQGPSGLPGASGATGPSGPSGPIGPSGGPVGPAGPQGQTGATGPSGPIGPNGLPGQTGPSGPSGPIGPSGSQGVTGNTGVAGPSGPSGPIGPIGPIGVTGNTGVAGPSGPSGPSGPLGPIGPIGGTGDTGVSGPTGPTGPQGGTGDTGVAGPVGPSGPLGPTGPQGVPGNTGVAGPSGPIGPTGPQGVTGNTGVAGPVGPSGPVGPTGPQGVTGNTGVAGPSGPSGPIGPTGPQGVTGNTGVAGPSGPSGPSGPIGPIGPIGVTGNTGVAGPSGPSGPIGATGVTGPSGPSGPSGPGGLSQYGHVYNTSSQVLLSGIPINFDTNGFITSGISHIPGASQITVNSAGIYKVAFSVSGTAADQFALEVNGVVVSGAGDTGSQPNVGQYILSLSAGDVLEIVNTSISMVTLPTPSGVTQTNASILIEEFASSL